MSQASSEEVAASLSNGSGADAVPKEGSQLQSMPEHVDPLVEMFKNRSNVSPDVTKVAGPN